MFEIELKAHVINRENVINRLNEMARYLCSRNKEDVYYTLLKLDGSDIGVRIRCESVKTDGKISEERTFTYKRKEIKKDISGNSIEVNDENEINLTKDDAAVLEKMFLDIGKIRLKKTKIVENWEMETKAGLANIELCTVPPLGDFLEIEIITEDDSPSHVEDINNEIKSIFTACGIDLSLIEDRFYSEMLRSVIK